MISPVWRTALCQNYENSGSSVLDLGNDRPATFLALLGLACGEPQVLDSMEELLELGYMADMYEVKAVRRLI